MRHWLLLAIMLVGCASASMEEQRAAIDAFTTEDLQAALQLATARQDLAAMTCYPALLQRIAQRQAKQPSPPKGAVSAYETLRLAVRSDDAVAEAIKVACAALAVQTGVDVAKIAAIAAGGIGNVSEALQGGKALLDLFKALGVGRGL